MEFRVDGLRVFAATGGRAFDPSLPVTVFVHGAAFDHTVWKLQARYFAWHGGSVLAVDLPGHGLSQGPLRGSIPEMADWLVALLDAAEVGQANLVGHSMGALVALEAAARHDARVRKLALLGAAPAIPSTTCCSAGRPRTITMHWSCSPDGATAGAPTLAAIACRGFG